MKNVSDGEVVAEGSDDQGDGSEENASENHNARTARGLAQALPVWVARKKEGDQTHSERIQAQRQGEEQGKATDLRHVGEPRSIFSETDGGGNRDKRSTGGNRGLKPSLRGGFTRR